LEPRRFLIQVPIGRPGDTHRLFQSSSQVDGFDQLAHRLEAILGFGQNATIQVPQAATSSSLLRRMKSAQVKSVSRVSGAMAVKQ
jgi:uncharacterized protein YaaN involved in tellurite resistance